MHKVTTINLSGKAYQLEEKGYSELSAYITAAGTALAANPDKKEILADIEQAIADKCERFLQGNKDVIDSEQVQTILSEMGPVEVDDGDETISDTSLNQTSRKLYQIPSGGEIAGVCNGIAAYIGVDVTIVRIAFIILTFATGGFWIFLYLLLLFVIPTARTDEQLAEAYGRRVSAQEIIDGAKGKAKDLEPTLSNLGSLIRKLVTIGFGIAAIVIAVAIACLTVAWIVALWWIFFGQLTLHGQLASVSDWTLAAGVTAAYFMFTLPQFAIARAFQRIANGQELTGNGRTLNMFSFGLWFVALAVFVIVSLSIGGRLRDYVETHNGFIDINSTHYCIDTSKCYTGRERLCTTDGICMPPPRPMLR